MTLDKHNRSILIWIIMDQGYNVYNIEPKFKEFLHAENISADTLKNYLSDLRHFLGWLSYRKIIKESFEEITRDTIAGYKEYLGLNKVPVITINRRLSTLRKLFDFLIQKEQINSNPAKQVPNIKIESKLNTIKNRFKKSKSSSQENISTSPSSSPSHENGIRLPIKIPFNIAVISLIFVILIITFKSRNLLINQDTQKKITQSNILNPKKGRTLAFKGKVFDSLGNPINSKTDVTFKIYTKENDKKAIYEGICKGVNGITPDTTGFVNIAIGKDCQMNAIPAAVFTDNANLYLGVTVGSDKELEPRQQIANVAYSLDAERLQGLDLGSKEGNIPFINEEGTIFLEASESSIRSINPEGNLTIASDNSLNLESGEQGDLTLQSGAFGSLKFKTGGFADTVSSLFIGSDGNVGIGSEDPNNFKVQVAGDIGPEVGDIYNIGSETGQWSNIYASKFIQNGVALCDEQGNNCPKNISSWTLSSPYLYMNEPNVKVGIGTSNTSSIISKLFVTKDPSEVGTGKALAIFDQTEYQDIITASASGTTRFVVKNNGNTGIGTYNPSARLDVSGGQTKIELSTQYTERLCHSGIDSNSTQNVLLGDCYSGGADLAEYYGSNESLEPGDIVIAKEGGKMIGVDSKAYIEKSKTSYDSRVIGIVSTNPYETFGKNYNADEKYYPVALVGRVPVKVSSESDEIHAGDLLTTSADSGKAMKAKNAGQIIGKALENWNKNQMKNEILVFVNISWADPTSTISSAGNLETQSSDINSNKYIYSGTVNDDTDEDYIFKNLLLGALQKENLLKQYLWQTQQSTAYKSGQIFTTAFSKAQNTLDDLVFQIRKVLVTEKIISPIVETTDLIASGSAILGEVHTNTIKAYDDNLTINLESNTSTSEAKGPLAELIIRGRDEKRVASIDAIGNATFSGTLTASEASISGQISTDNLAANSILSNSLAVSDASISGTLVAKEIQSDTIRALEQRINSLAQSSTANNLLLASNSATIASASPSATIASNLNTGEKSTDEKNSNMDLNEIQKLIAQLKNSSLPDPNYYHAPENLPKLTEGSQISPEEAQKITSVDTLAKFENMTVTGNANFYKMNIADSVTIGTLVLENDSILSLSNNLNISALSTITLFDGAITIARDGTMTSNGQIIARSGIKTKTIEPIEKNLIVKLPSSTSTSDSSVNNGKLIIANAAGTEVASIDASGSAQFDEISVSKYMEATESGSLISAKDNFQKNGIFAPALDTEKKTAGNGILPENSTEVVIYNDKIKAGSLVYLTPTEQLIDGQLSILKKESCDAGVSECKPYFKVGISKAEHAQVSFNWLIIN